VRCACIDVGSNTTRLLVAEAHDGAIAALANERVFTLIGRSLAGGDRIPLAKIDETAAVVAGQAEHARDLGAQRIRAVATAAIRRASNAPELADAVLTASGVRLEVLAGEEEARLAFRGAARAVAAGGAPGGGTLAVIDVGGGSTEVAFGHADGRIDVAHSLPIGSSLLTERHLRSDPPAAAELAAARAELRTVLDGFEPRPVDRAVAVGGSASSLERLAGNDLGSEQIAAALDDVCREPAAVRAPRVGLDPYRIRLLPAGLLVLAELSARLSRPLRICKGGLREGVILEMIGA
jgi:exopolyphosphatase / guanosine-5'-triphosphate,3'-diphosphate pyrophosphatase